MDGGSTAFGRQAVLRQTEKSASSGCNFRVIISCCLSSIIAPAQRWLLPLLLLLLTCLCVQAYQGAVQTLGAVADRLRASSGRFFFGDKPTSLDAVLFGHLAFYKHSPVAAPVLRDKVR
jgi:hypothetical protein